MATKIAPVPAPIVTSQFITQQDIITDTLISGQRRRFELAYKEAINQAATEADKIAVRQQMYKIIKGHISEYEEYIAKARAEYEKAVQKGTLAAWNTQYRQELAAFNANARAKIANAAAENAANRAFASDLGKASRSQAYSESKGKSETRSEFMGRTAKERDLWKAQANEEAATQVGSSTDNVLNSYIIDRNGVERIPQADRAFRGHVNRLIDEKSGTGTYGFHNLIEKVYDAYSEPEARQDALDDISSIVAESLDEEALSQFQELRRQRASLDYDSTKKSFSGDAPLGESYKAAVVKTSAGEFKPSDSLSDSQKAMLEDVTPSEQTLNELIATYEQAIQDEEAKASTHEQAIEDYLNTNRNTIDIARDIYHTRFGTQKQRPTVINDQFRRMTPGDIAEAKKLAAERIASIEEEKRAKLIEQQQALEDKATGDFNSSDYVDSGLDETTPYFEAPPSSLHMGRVPPNPTTNANDTLSRKKLIERLQLINQPSQPTSKPDTSAAPKPRAVVPRPDKAPTHQELNAYTGNEIMGAIERGRDLASKSRKFERLMSQDPIAKNIASVYSVDNRNKIPIKTQIDKILAAYQKEPAKQIKAIEYLFAIREIDKNKTLIQPQ